MSLLRRPLRAAVGDVEHVCPVPFHRADGPVRAVYEQLERDFGMLAPPVALHAPAPELLAASWAVLRETLLVEGALTRAEKEAVAAAVSAANACPYCEGIHSAARDGLDPGADWSALPLWLAGLPGPCPSRAPAETVGIAVVFHYLNRVVNVFLGDSPLPDGAPALVRRAAGRVLVRLTTTTAPVPGESVPLLSAGVGTTHRDRVTRTFAAASASFERAGRRSVPAPVRAAVLASLGTAPDGPCRVEEAADRVDESLRPVARLALLVAGESYRVDDGVVAAARTAGLLGDRALVELVGWAAFAAARHHGADLLARVDAVRAREAA